jgi:cell division protein FtsB
MNIQQIHPTRMASRRTSTFSTRLLVVLILAVLILTFFFVIGFTSRSNTTTQQACDNTQLHKAIDELSARITQKDQEITQLKNSKEVSTLSNIESSTTSTTPKVYHINYAHNCCYEAQKRNCQVAYSVGKADKCIAYGKNDIDPDFAQQNEYILKQGRGAGYWIWKPYFILHTMVNVAMKDDYIFYTDSDYEQKSPFLSPDFPKIKELLDTQNIVVFPVGLPEIDWTKRDAYILIGIDTEEARTTSQMNACAVLVKNTMKAQRFISAWLTYMQDRRLATDDSNTLEKPNFLGFAGHRHDQSVLSLLTKKWKLVTHPLSNLLNDNHNGKA